MAVMTTARPLWQVARDVRAHWPKVSPYAEPYLDAMRALDSLNDWYGLDSAVSIVLYFLSNARTWHGEDAKRVKAELNAMLKAHTKATEKPSPYALAA